MERGCLYADSIVWRNVHSRRVCTVCERWSKAFEDLHCWGTWSSRRANVGTLVGHLV